MTGKNDRACARRNLHALEMIEGKMRHHRGFEAWFESPSSRLDGRVWPAGQISAKFFGDSGKPW
jgi:hypothetical protein